MIEHSSASSVAISLLILSLGGLARGSDQARKPTR
jgi:hypothetical protein